MGNECDESTGHKCWGGVANCNAFKLLEYETMPGVNNNGIINVEDHNNDHNNNDQNVNNQNQNDGVNYNDYEGGDMGMGVQVSDKCSSEVYQCKSGQFVARAPELNCGFYPCPVITDDDDDDDDETTFDAPTTPTNTNTNAPVVAVVVPPLPTYPPTYSPTIGVPHDNQLE